MCRAYASPLHVPSLVRHYGSIKGGAAAAASGLPALRRASPLPLFLPRRAYFIEDYNEEEILKYIFEKIHDTEKQLRRLKIFQCMSLIALVALASLYYQELSRLHRRIAVLKEKVTKLKTMVPADCHIDDDEDDLA